MASGLLVLLDDVAAIAKAAAASLDDVSAQAFKAGSKAAGVVIDDAAVTPKYVIGLSPAREIPIVWNIAKGSLKNKLVFLMPALLLLGFLAPWSISPLLAVGGLFLCFEGYEKLHHMFRGFVRQKHASPVGPVVAMNLEELEQLRTAGAIRTDFILSAEIMAIAYDVVRDDRFLTKVGVLLVVAIAITGGVYGFVGLILKADDLGLHLARHGTRRPLRIFGRMLIAAMPWLLVVLGFVGTAAMLWVGGGIVIHAFPQVHERMHDYVGTLDLPSSVASGAEAGIGLIAGIAIGFVVASIVGAAKAYFPRDRTSPP